MMGDEALFVDTNVLLAACDESRHSHQGASRLLEEGLAGKRSLFTSGQVFREFLVVATRPADVNGLGMIPADALANLTEFTRCLRLAEETEAVSRRLRELVGHYQLSGKRIHDANIAATMLAHGMTHLVTGNPADFEVFPDIVQTEV